MNHLLDNFELLLEAPDGIKRLREIILQLAVKGKLVPQDPNDEPASVLLEKIKEEKERLIREGKIKPEKPLPPIKKDEIPYELPTGWEWVRLGDIIELISGQHINEEDYNETQNGTPYITGPSDFGDLFPKLSKWTLKPKVFAKKNDILLTVKGAGLGKINKLNVEDVAIGRQLMAIRSAFININYIFVFLWSKYNYFQSTGIGIAIPGIGRAQILDILIPLTSEKEQQRIVEKVDQLMKLCDELEKMIEERNKSQVSLNNAALNKLSSASDIKAFQQEWERIIAHFDTLFAKPENVKSLKQTILQLAVKGKLVPQDPNDEPASVLLEKIKEEKERLIREGKIKPEKPLPPIKKDEIPYELPTGWEWVRLQQVVSFDKYAIKRGPFGSSIKKSYFVPSGYKVYEQKNAIYNDFSLGNYYINEEKFYELKSFQVKAKDIIISCSGTVGKIAIAPENIEAGIINQALLKITLNTNVLLNEYFVILFPSYFMATDALNDLKGTAQKNITSVITLNSILFHLPPLAEQQRIVEKVDRLMELCDRLEDRLKQSEIQRETLFKSVANHISMEK